MKKHILNFFAFTGVLLLLLIIFCSSSCNKNKTTHGKIYVIDVAGAYVAAANVRLSAPNSQVAYNGTTDGGGYVQFDINLPAIFDVTASKDSLIGTAILRLDEPGKTTELTVTIR